ncbi:MAG TPA: AAA family ATPase [Smithellaceae bacterium]|nr:AAA family ATPase [Smithellaceae bacterium]
MNENVFARMPADQLKKLADYGVNGAEKELDRRRKNPSISVTETMVTAEPDLQEDSIGEEISEEATSAQCSTSVAQETHKDGIEIYPAFKKSSFVPDSSVQIKPTDEQNKILNVEGRIIKINARAGTGKTATLFMIARQNPDKKIIYLVFNSRNRQEARDKFPSNVAIHTIHSFTRAIAGRHFSEHLIIRPSLFFDHFVLKKEILATLTSDFIVFFLNSIYQKPVDAIEPFKKKLPDELSNIFLQSQSSILEISRDKLNSWYKDSTNCPHDFYLKLSHRENTFQSRLSKYDLVLIDEGQDLSPIMIDALSIYKGRVIIVGDSHQQIYSFRYAEDAMQNFKHDEMFDLTMSFRFGEKIAAFVSKFIKCSKEDRKFKLTGNPAVKSQVHFYDNISLIENRSNTAILSRTNFSLFKNALLLKSKKQLFCFGRDISAELHKTLNVYWLSEDQTSKINDDLIKSFKSVDALQEYATAISDYQLIKILELVKVYKDEFPQSLFDFLKLCKEDKGIRDHKAIILSTIHAAKGQEYDHVVIDEDVIPRLDVSNNKVEYNYFEEVNIVYVGMTRARQSLYLPAGMKKLFDDEWQNYANRIPVISPKPVDNRRIIKNSSTISRRKKGYGTFVKDMPPNMKNESLKTVPDLHVSDTVRTLSGYGQIIKIEGDQCLINMENIEGKVWERRSTLVKVRKIPT